MVIRRLTSVRVLCWLLTAILLYAQACTGAEAQPVDSLSISLTPQERDWLSAHPVIRLAPDPDFPPVEFFDQEGTYRGITADFVALIERSLGLRFSIVRLPNWDAILAADKNK